MEHNVTYVKRNPELREGARALAERAMEKAAQLVEADAPVEKTVRGGRKAHRMEEVE